MKVYILLGLLLLIDATSQGTAKNANDTGKPRLPLRKQNIQLNLNFNLGLFDCNSTDCCAKKTCNGTGSAKVPPPVPKPPKRHHWPVTKPGLDVSPPFLVIEVVPKPDPWPWNPDELRPTEPTPEKKDYPRVGEYIQVNVCDYNFDNGESCRYFCGLLGYLEYKCEDLVTCHCWEKKPVQSTSSG